MSSQRAARDRSADAAGLLARAGDGAPAEVTAAFPQHPTGRSAAAVRVRQLIAQVARFDTTVLILGESGTGKEGVARELHRLSNRAAGPFVPVNCAAIPAELMESELFGHERGAFSGAVAQRRGRFELADGGTLFLDEVSEMAPQLQAKLLRVLQERTYERVGSGELRTADVRIVAATNRDLDVEVASGRFRGDLYFRLNVFPIELAPLRERIEDLPLLIETLGESLGLRGHGTVSFSASAVAALAGYRWPGNVRELENLLERLAILHPGAHLAPGDLPERFAGGAAQPMPAAPVGAPDTGGGFVLPAGGVQLRDLVQRFEDDLIAQAMDRAAGVIAEAARLLGIGRTTLVEKLKRREQSAA
jgi:sigma-54 dependent transcriptional regulator, flagellar regulatory protein